MSMSAKHLTLALTNEVVRTGPQECMEPPSKSLHWAWVSFSPVCVQNREIISQDLDWVKGGRSPRSGRPETLAICGLHAENCQFSASSLSGMEHVLGKRRGWDSNPRWPEGHTGFRNRPVQPLRHLSRCRRVAAKCTSIDRFAPRTSATGNGLKAPRACRSRRRRLCAWRGLG